MPFISLRGPCPRPLRPLRRTMPGPGPDMPWRGNGRFHWSMRSKPHHPPPPLLLLSALTKRPFGLRHGPGPLWLTCVDNIVTSFFSTYKRRRGTVTLWRGIIIITSIPTLPLWHPSWLTRTFSACWDDPTITTTTTRRIQSGGPCCTIACAAAMPGRPETLWLPCHHHPPPPPPPFRRPYHA